MKLKLKIFILSLFIIFGCYSKKHNIDTNKAIHAKNVAKAIMIINERKLDDLFFTSDKLEDLNIKI